jgi:hypothetical protein
VYFVILGVYDSYRDKRVVSDCAFSCRFKGKSAVANPY